jgi:SAM-dependent MidA family methyltransferase
MRFLVSLGLAQLLAEAARVNDVASIRERLALHSLMAPGGMGDIFKVLLLTRGIPAADLTGARDPFRSGRGELRMTGEA